METAADALDGIRKGGGNLLVTAHNRLAEIRSAMDEGDFVGAHAASAQLYEKLSHLAGAQAALGRLADAHIIHADEITAGMVLEAGPVASVEPCPSCHGESEQCSVIRLVLADGSDLVVPGDTEIVVNA